MKGQIYLTREQALKVQAWKQAVMYLTAVTIQKTDHLEIWKACDMVRELKNDLFPGMNNILYPDEKASFDKLKEEEKGANKMKDMKDMKAKKVEANQEYINKVVEATITENMPVALGPWADAESVPMEGVKKICNIMGRRCYARGLEHGSLVGKFLGYCIRVILGSEEGEDEGNEK